MLLANTTRFISRLEFTEQGHHSPERRQVIKGLGLRMSIALRNTGEVGL